jgi:hypothetical protein
VSVIEADCDVSNANFDAEFAVSIIQTLRRVAALISQAQTKLHDVTPTGGVWPLLSGVGFICCYGQRWQGKLRIGRNLEPVQQTTRKVLHKHVSLLFFFFSQLYRAS